MDKALIIAYNDLNNSGVPNVIYQTIKALHDYYSFDVLIFGDDEYYYHKLHNEGIDINVIKYIEKRPSRKIARLFWWFYKRPHDHYLFMKRLLKDNHYSVIHSFKEYDCWPFFKAAKESGIDKRIFHRNINPKPNPQSIVRLLEYKNRRLSLKYSSLFIGVSELSCRNAFKDKKYTVLHNSYDEKKYNMNVANKLNDDELVISHVASYGENKNQLFSLEVLKSLKELHSNVKLNLVGATEMNPYYQRLIDYVKENGLEDNVSFIDRTNDVDKVYEKTTFVIIPSYREGFSLVAVEAQVCGISVFASSTIPDEVNCGGVRFFDLSNGSTYWAMNINRVFIEQHNNRYKYNLDKFSFNRFKKSLVKFYGVCKYK